jgi:hypothetical protein
MGIVRLGMVMLLIVGCSKSGRGIDGTDESLDDNPPARIADLEVSAFDSTSVALRWSAPGDDFDSGSASQYDLRYSLDNTTLINWDSAISSTEVPTPSAPSTPDSFTVAGLIQDSIYFFAIKTADERGNWSTISNVVSAACIADGVVAFPDTALERIIRFYIGKPTADILRSDMLTFGHLNAWYQHLHDLAGLEYARNIHTLRIGNNSVTSLIHLAGLGKLRVRDVGHNELSDITPVASLAALDTLKLSSNQIEDVSALANLNNLTDLELANNQISILSPLAGKTTIRHLALEGNRIVYMDPLHDLTGLEKLILSYNQINDILALAENSGLGAGDSLWLTGNPLSASRTDSLISALRNRGVSIIY